MATINKRLDDLESLTGASQPGLAVFYTGDEFAKMVKPTDRQGEEITRQSFEIEFPDGQLIVVEYVEKIVEV